MKTKTYMFKKKGRKQVMKVGSGFACGVIMPKTKKGQFDLSKVIENVGKDA